MDEKFKDSLKGEWELIKSFTGGFVKWSLIAAVIGLAGGIIGSAFYKSVAFVTAAREARQWLLYLLPLGGLAIVFLYKITGTEGKNTNDIIDSILFGKDVPLKLTPVIFLSTVITHLFGGSAGREGAALQIGGSLGCTAGKILKLDEKEERTAILAGMSAVFSALFGTPITATVFALEVSSVGIIHYSGLVPCGVAALSAYGVTQLFGIAPTRFFFIGPDHGGVMLLKVAILAVLCAVLSVIFCKVMHPSGHLAAKLLKNEYIRAAAGGAAIIAMSLLLGTRDYNGGGVNIITAAIEQGEAKAPAFLLKMLFTAVTLSCCYKGGEIVPTFFIGATFGCVLGPLLGIPAGFAAAIGLTATFCGAVNCPLASTILAVELFGSEYVVYFAAACFISYMLSGYASLYEEQRIVYSKVRNEYINRRAD